MRIYRSHPEWSTWHHETTINSGKNVGKKKPSAPVSGVKAGGATLKIRVEAAKKLKQIFIWFSCTTIPGHMYTQKGLSNLPQGHLHISVYWLSFHNTKERNLAIHGCMEKEMWSIDTMELCSVMKNNEMKYSR